MNGSMESGENSLINKLLGSPIRKQIETVEYKARISLIALCHYSDYVAEVSSVAQQPSMLSVCQTCLKLCTFQ